MKRRRPPPPEPPLPPKTSVAAADFDEAISDVPDVGHGERRFLVYSLDSGEWSSISASDAEDAAILANENWDQGYEEWGGDYVAIPAPPDWGGEYPEIEPQGPILHVRTIACRSLESTVRRGKRGQDAP